MPNLCRSKIEKSTDQKIHGDSCPPLASIFLCWEKGNVFIYPQDADTIYIRKSKTGLEGGSVKQWTHLDRKQRLDANVKPEDIWSVGQLITYMYIFNIRTEQEINMREIVLDADPTTSSSLNTSPIPKWFPFDVPQPKQSKNSAIGGGECLHRENGKLVRKPLVFRCKSSGR